MHDTTRDAFEIFAKLLPGASLIAAIFLANRQLQSSRRATAITIAKNHYRKLLSICTDNADIVYRGATAAALADLKSDVARYKKYRWLVTQALFALQEIYFAIPDDEHWRKTIRIIGSNFRAFILSDEELPPRQKASWHPAFMEFLIHELERFEHPIVALGVPLGDERPGALRPPVGSRPHLGLVQDGAGEAPHAAVPQA